MRHVMLALLAFLMLGTAVLGTGCVSDGGPPPDVYPEKPFRKPFLFWNNTGVPYTLVTDRSRKNTVGPHETLCAHALWTGVWDKRSKAYVYSPDVSIEDAKGCDGNVLHWNDTSDMLIYGPKR